MATRRRTDSTGSDDVIATEDIPGLSGYGSRSNSPIPRSQTNSIRRIESSDSPPSRPTSQTTPLVEYQRVEYSPSDFYFGEILGEGAYARVVHGRKKNSVKDYAIKIMEKAHIKKENKVKYVIMERNILTKVSHDFIIKFYYSFQDEVYLYMCMDLAPGGELLSVINHHLDENQRLGMQNKACDEATTRFYSSEIVEALEYLHGHNIIHRDMKPENILISAGGHIKVTDFGTAFIDMGSETTTRNSFVGTAEYVSPEVLENEEATKACDLWALGCIIYQIQTGITPFRSINEFMTFQSIHDHISGVNPVKYPSFMNEETKDLITHLLLPKPQDRLGSGDSDVNGYSALKSHIFFCTTPWGNLLSATPPYIPNESKFPNPNMLRSGADANWIFDGEATPILNGRLRGQSIEDDDPISIGQSSSPQNLRDSTQSNSALNKQSFSQNKNSSKNSKPLFSGKTTSQVVNDVSQFLDANEKKIFTGIVLKRVGLFSKRRQLILSDQPRLIYFDTDTHEVKGTIPWELDHPVKCEIINDSAFDVLCTKSGRRYHLTAVDTGSAVWVDFINAMISQQQELGRSLADI